ncbi:TlpA disulfide reductase family protein [Sinomicrobium oceani]|uniref:TlpA disulfide reductase family protein n=1 Tax=Sinomicrobium oceani TaxID=1150368 RepID=UPI001587C89B|nr:TlpA disulfide reductase family protein [Sinomicrobium oceani]
MLWLLCFVTSAIAQENNYKIKGHLTGDDVPMKVLLYYRDGNRKVADSVMAEKNRFVFTGKLDHPTQAAISVQYHYPSDKEKDSIISEGVNFMLDLGTTTIQGTSVQTAEIKGSKAQEDFKAYRSIVDSVGNVVYKIWKRQQEELPEDSTAAFKRLLYARSKIIRSITQHYVKTHPKSGFSFWILQSNTVLINDLEYVESLMEILKPEFGNFPRFKELEEKIVLTRRLAIGEKATDFSQINDQGVEVSLSDLRGKYVLIDFWASWCGPCRAEYPYLKRVYKKYGHKNFEILGVSLDDKESVWRNAITSNGFEWIQLADLKGRHNAVAIAYGISAIPQNFLIDPQGIIIAKNLRGEELEEKLSEIID